MISQEIWSLGLFTSFAGMGIVFSGLLLLYCTVALTSWIMNRPSRETDSNKSEADIVDMPEEITEEEVAAISMALHLYHLKYEEAEHFKLTGERTTQENRPYTLAGRLQEVKRDLNRGFVPGRAHIIRGNKP